MEPDKPVRRIVSKREYVKLQSIRFGLNLSSLSFLMFAVSCGLATLCLGAMLALTIDKLFTGYFTYYSILVSVTLLIGGATFLFFRLFGITGNKAKAVEKVALVSRANSGHLPAVESLVRASEMPVAEQQFVLLRPSAEQDKVPVDQLLRPIDDNTVEVNTLRN